MSGVEFADRRGIDVHLLYRRRRRIRRAGRVPTACGGMLEGPRVAPGTWAAEVGRGALGGPVSHDFSLRRTCSGATPPRPRRWPRAFPAGSSSVSEWMSCSRSGGARCWIAAWISASLVMAVTMLISDRLRVVYSARSAPRPLYGPARGCFVVALSTAAVPAASPRSTVFAVAA